jgi:hypothetical protein
MMKQRLLVPELLDSMDAADPRAIRSRLDLRIINAFLGNERWIRSMLREHSVEICSLLELGAGDGHLLKRLHGIFPEVILTGLDLRARPEGLPSGIRWIRENFLETLTDAGADACIGNLILHHFDSEALLTLGGKLQEFRLLLFSEPLRKELPMRLARMVLPLAGEVTRHDMPASIRAGFLKGELPSLLGLDPAHWNMKEYESGRGSLRLMAIRK